MAAGPPDASEVPEPSHRPIPMEEPSCQTYQHTVRPSICPRCSHTAIMVIWRVLRRRCRSESAPWSPATISPWPYCGPPEKVCLGFFSLSESLFMVGDVSQPANNARTTRMRWGKEGSTEHATKPRHVCRKQPLVGFIEVTAWHTRQSQGRYRLVRSWRAMLPLGRFAGSLIRKASGATPLQAGQEIEQEQARYAASQRVAFALAGFDSHP